MILKFIIIDINLINYSYLYINDALFNILGQIVEFVVKVLKTII